MKTKTYLILVIFIVLHCINASMHQLRRIKFAIENNDPNWIGDGNHQDLIVTNCLTTINSSTKLLPQIHSHVIEWKLNRRCLCRKMLLFSSILSSFSIDDDFSYGKKKQKIPLLFQEWVPSSFDHLSFFVSKRFRFVRIPKRSIFHCFHCIYLGFLFFLLPIENLVWSIDPVCFPRFDCCCCLHLNGIQIVFYSLRYALFQARSIGSGSAWNRK